MRGRVTCAKDSRLALPVSGIFISRAFRLSCMRPRSTPSSISTVRCVGLPSSSTVSEPRRPGSVPSSTTVTPGEATRCPMRPANAELPLRLKSPSSPWPTASCNSTPGQPGPSTTVIVPGLGEVRIVPPSAAARGAGLAPAVLLGDHLHRQAHQRPHVGGDAAVGARDQHHLVLAAQARHHLRDARVERAAFPLQLLEQRYLVRGAEGGGRIDRAIQRQGERFLIRLDPADLARSGNRARRLCGILQRVEADLVGIGEGRLLAGNGPHAHTLLDVEAARLDDAFLQAPALEARVLEIQIGVIHLAGGERAEHPLELAGFQLEGGKQRALCGFENQFSLLLAMAGSDARTSCTRSVSISASSTPSPSGRTARTWPHGSTIMLCP